MSKKENYNNTDFVHDDAWAKEFVSHENPDEENKKPGRIARLKAYLSRTSKNRKIEKQFKKEQKLIDEEKNKVEKDRHIKDNKRIDQYFDDIVNQLEKVDEQNNMLLFYLNTVKENNEALLKQINVLTENNKQLLTHIEGSKRRERIAKIFAISSSILAIGLSVWKFLQLFGIL